MCYTLYMELYGVIFMLVCTFGTALAALVWAIVRKKGLVKPLLLGALCFAVFQLFTRLPLLQLVLPFQPWFALLSTAMPYLYAALLGVSAAVFEECGRLIVMALFMKKTRRFEDGLSFGLGHGCFEAAVLVGVNGLALLLSGQYAALPAGGLFLAGAERLIVLPMHVAWSVMVLESLATRRAAPFFWALLLHAAVDTFAGAATLFGIAPLLIEGVFLMVSLLLVYYIYRARLRWPVPTASAPRADAEMVPGTPSGAETETETKKELILSE